MSAATTNSGPTPQQANNAARASVMNNAIRISQPILSQTVVPANINNQLTLNLQNVGLTTDLIVDITATINLTTQGTLTPWGAANILSNILFLDNYSTQRVNTSGRHLHMLASYKAGRPYSSANTLSGYGIPGFGNNYNAISASSGTGTGNKTVTMRYHIPFVRDLRRDLRGAMLTNVTQGSFQLTLTFNPTPCVASGSAFKAVYGGGAVGSITTATVVVYQKYFDNLPRAANRTYILPAIDMSQYLAMTESVWPSPLTQAADNYIQFNPNQAYYSRTLFFDNGGTNAATDVNYFEKLSANFTPILKNYPVEQAAQDDVRLGIEPPIGTWYADYSSKPMTLQVAGNQSLVFNPALVNANANLYVSDESYIGLAQSGIIAVQ